MSRRALVLDFDGVIADSVREAFSVALRTRCALEPHSSLRSVLERIDPRCPEKEASYELFLELMPLGNRAEDYAVALLAIEQGVPLPDQAAFDAFKAQLDGSSLRAFHQRFYEVRAAWRREDPQGWLAATGPYPELVELLKRRAADVELAIATAKDRRSVRDLLASYGAGHLFAEDRILDKETGVNKRAHLERLQVEIGVPFSEMIFIEDKVNHLESVASLGVRCVLAAWGYNGPREHERARGLGFLVCGLEDLERRLFGGDVL